MLRTVIALGGNAIKQAYEKGTAEEQLRNCILTSRNLAGVIMKMESDDRLVITHGNGPQAGNLMLQQEEAEHIVPSQPLDMVGAMTQGQIGYMLQQTLTNCLKELGIEKPVCAIINRVLVDESDPEFCGETASKPVGDFFTEITARRMKKKHPEWMIKKVKPTGDKSWRRVVPSPDPIANLEASVIRNLVEAGVIVIASGGGGIPVAIDATKCYRGVEAVIDKDLAGEKLAEVVDADVLLILTDVEKVKLNYGKPEEKAIDQMSLSEAKKYLEDGHFLKGSMEPKIKACVRFLEWGGKKAIITSPDKAALSLQGNAGTLIYPHRPADVMNPRSDLRK
jgi:carbamate kinase